MNCVISVKYRMAVCLEKLRAGIFNLMWRLFCFLLFSLQG